MEGGVDTSGGKWVAPESFVRQVGRCAQPPTVFPCARQHPHRICTMKCMCMRVAASVPLRSRSLRVLLVQTRKYWVPPESVNQVKALIVRHLPVLVYGKSSKKAPELSILTKGEAVQTNDGQVRGGHGVCRVTALCVCTACV
jgi:hypothetical protein